MRIVETINGSDWSDEFSDLTTEQLLEESSKGAEEAIHKMQVAAQTNTLQENPLEKLTDAELLEQWQAEADKITQAERDQKAFDAARQFVAETPAYVESEYNAVRIDAYVKAKYGADYVPTPDDLHAVFDTLASRGLLQTRVVPRSPRPVMTEAQLEAMPIEELEQLAREDAVAPGKYRRAL